MIPRLALFTASLALLAAAALAGGDCASGSTCENRCPLAQRANQRLATGHEAIPVSRLVRVEYVKRVLLDLESI